MKNTVSHFGRLIGYAALSALPFFASWRLFRPDIESDPDRYFNLGVAAEISFRGSAHTLPQFPLIGWDKIFPDKEFLYHQALGVFYRLGGEPLVLAFVPLLAGLLSMLLVSRLHKKVSWPLAALAVVAIASSNPHFAFRMGLLRSFAFAEVFVLILWFALEDKRPWLCGISSFILAMSFNAWSLIVIAAAASLTGASPVRAQVRLILCSLTGLVLGIVLNPAFPNHVEMTFVGHDIALNRFAGAGMTHGSEIAWASSLQFAAMFSLHAALTVYGLVCAFRDKQSRPIGLFCGILGWMTWKDPAAAEFWVPAVVLLIPSLIRSLPKAKLIPYVALSIAVFFQLGAHVQRHFDSSFERPTPSTIESLRSLVAPIPAGARLLYTDWSLGGYLFYLRRDLELVDVLDPVFLFLEAPEKYLLRRELHEGAQKEWAALIPEKFGAHWIIADSRGSWEQLKGDSHFSLVKDAPFTFSSGERRYDVAYGLFRIR